MLPALIFEVNHCTLSGNFYTFLAQFYTLLAGYVGSSAFEAH